MKNNVKHIIFCALVILFVTSVFIGLDGKSVKAATNGFIQQSYSNIDEYYGKKAPDCEVENYIFAGWYKDEACEVSYVKSPDENITTFYAKFVPKEVLSVKTQTEKRLNNDVLGDDATGKIRIVTSVDSTNYQDVGFYVSGTFENVTLENEKYSIPKVFSYLYVVGTTDDKSDAKTAKETFGLEQAKFFAPHTFNTRFDQFNDKFKITPYWVTADGVEVKGVYREVSIIDNLEFHSCAEVNGRAYYTSNDLHNIIDKANKLEGTEENPTVITLLKDVEVSKQTAIEGHTKITNKEGKQITVSKADTWGDANFWFIFTNGNVLEIVGADASRKDNITFDGKNAKSLIRNNSTLVIKNTSFINGYIDGNAQGNNGGAINSMGGTSTAIDNCSFVANKATNNGGVIYLNAGSVQIVDSEFKQNYTTTQGGVIYANGAKIQVSGSNFEGNYTTSSNGGAIAAVSLASNSQITNSTFYGNQAKAGSGGVIWQSGSTLDIVSCEFGSKTAPNKAKTNGGAIYLSDKGTLELTVNEQYTYKSMNYNTANNGGAILAFGTVNATGYDFVGNQANASGGAISGECNTTTKIYSIINVFDCNFTQNKATSTHGGAIYAKVKMSATKCVFDSNTAGNYGGAIMLGGATLPAGTERVANVTDSEFYGNSAKNAGAVGSVGNNGCIAYFNLHNCDFNTLADITKRNYASALGGLACSTGYGNIKITCDDGVSRNFDNNVDANGDVFYVKSNSHVEYSSTYSSEDVEYTCADTTSSVTRK